MAPSGFAYEGTSTTDGTFLDFGTAVGTNHLYIVSETSYIPNCEYFEGRIFSGSKEEVSKKLANYKAEFFSKQMIAGLCYWFIAEIREYVRKVILKPPSTFLSQIQIEYEKWKKRKLMIGLAF